MLQLLRHALHSSFQTDSLVATFILLPHWRGSSGNAYMNWINNNPGDVRVLAKVHARCIKFELPQYWFNDIPNPLILPTPHSLLLSGTNKQGRPYKIPTRTGLNTFSTASLKPNGCLFL
eukprot:1144581-Pelagomonas_calceolata.AAC.16